jgi:hypothetical protein
VRVLTRAAHVEGEIALHAVGGAPDLVGQRFGGGGERIGVRHLEDAGDAAHDGGTAAGFEVFLVLGPRLPQVDLAVDHAGQDVEPGAIDDGTRLCPCVRADAVMRPPETAMSRWLTPSWLTTVPFFRINSAWKGMIGPWAILDRGVRSS